jgi:hypothetical protein
MHAILTLMKFRRPLALLSALLLLPPLNIHSQSAHAHTIAAESPEASYSPIANPAAVVTMGHVRFTVLTPQLIRMEWAADGKFEDHA